MADTDNNGTDELKYSEDISTEKDVRKEDLSRGNRLEQLATTETVETNSDKVLDESLYEKTEGDTVNDEHQENSDSRDFNSSSDDNSNQTTAGSGEVTDADEESNALGNLYVDEEHSEINQDDSTNAEIHFQPLQNALDVGGFYKDNSPSYSDDQAVDFSAAFSSNQMGDAAMAVTSSVTSVIGLTNASVCKAKSSTLRFSDANYEKPSVAMSTINSNEHNDSVSQGNCSSMLSIMNHLSGMNKSTLLDQNSSSSHDQPNQMPRNKEIFVFGSKRKGQGNSKHKNKYFHIDSDSDSDSTDKDQHAKLFSEINNTSQQQHCGAGTSPEKLSKDSNNSTDCLQTTKSTLHLSESESPHKIEKQTIHEENVHGPSNGVRFLRSRTIIWDANSDSNLLFKKHTDHKQSKHKNHVRKHDVVLNDTECNSLPAYLTGTSAATLTGVLATCTESSINFDCVSPVSLSLPPESVSERKNGEFLSSKSSSTSAIVQLNDVILTGQSEETLKNTMIVKILSEGSSHHDELHSVDSSSKCSKSCNDSIDPEARTKSLCRTKEQICITSDGQVYSNHRNLKSDRLMKKLQYSNVDPLLEKASCSCAEEIPQPYQLDQAQHQSQIVCSSSLSHESQIMTNKSNSLVSSEIKCTNVNKKQCSDTGSHLSSSIGDESDTFSPSCLKINICEEDDAVSPSVNISRSSSCSSFSFGNVSSGKKTILDLGSYSQVTNSDVKKLNMVNSELKSLMNPKPKCKNVCNEQHFSQSTNKIEEMSMSSSIHIVRQRNVTAGNNTRQNSSVLFRKEFSSSSSNSSMDTTKSETDTKISSGKFSSMEEMSHRNLECLQHLLEKQSSDDSKIGVSSIDCNASYLSKSIKISGNSDMQCEENISSGFSGLNNVSSAAENNHLISDDIPLDNSGKGSNIFEALHKRSDFPKSSSNSSHEKKQAGDGLPLSASESLLLAKCTGKRDDVDDVYINVEGEKMSKAISDQINRCRWQARLASVDDEASCSALPNVTQELLASDNGHNKNIENSKGKSCETIDIIVDDDDDNIAFNESRGAGSSSNMRSSWREVSRHERLRYSRRSRKRPSMLRQAEEADIVDLTEDVKSDDDGEVEVLQHDKPVVYLKTENRHKRRRLHRIDMSSSRGEVSHTIDISCNESTTPSHPIDMNDPNVLFGELLEQPERFVVPPLPSSPGGRAVGRSVSSHSKSIISEDDKISAAPKCQNLDCSDSGGDSIRTAAGPSTSAALLSCSSSYELPFPSDKITLGEHSQGTSSAHKQTTHPTTFVSSSTCDDDGDVLAQFGMDIDKIYRHMGLSQHDIAQCRELGAGRDPAVPASHVLEHGRPVSPPSPYTRPPPPGCCPDYESLQDATVRQFLQQGSVAAGDSPSPQEEHSEDNDRNLLHRPRVYQSSPKRRLAASADDADHENPSLPQQLQVPGTSGSNCINISVSASIEPPLVNAFRHSDSNPFRPPHTHATLLHNLFSGQRLPSSALTIDQQLRHRSRQSYVPWQESTSTRHESLAGPSNSSFSSIFGAVRNTVARSFHHYYDKLTTANAVASILPSRQRSEGDGDDIHNHSQLQYDVDNDSMAGRMSRYSSQPLQSGHMGDGGSSNSSSNSNTTFAGVSNSNSNPAHVDVDYQVGANETVILEDDDVISSGMPLSSLSLPSSSRQSSSVNAAVTSKSQNIPGSSSYNNDEALLEYGNSSMPGTSSTRNASSSGAVQAQSLADARAEEISCPICLNTLSELLAESTALVSTVCGHLFCEPCLEPVVRSRKQCPTCRKKLTKRQYHKLYL